MEVSITFPYIFKHLFHGRDIMYKGTFLDLVKGLKLSIFTLFFPLPLSSHLVAWTGVSSFSTKFLILQDNFLYAYWHA